MRYHLTASVALLVATAITPAWAHARLKTSVPEKDATLKSAPAAVDIDFSEAVNAKLSKITVQDSKGERIDRDDNHVAAGDPKHLTVDLKDVPAGTYTVNWTSVAADDGHKLTGSFKFTVAP